MRHTDASDLAVRGYAVTHPSGTVVSPTEPGWDQLLYASSGTMSVATDAGTWVIPPHRALWAPDGADHRIVMHGRVSVRTLYLRSRLAVLPAAWRAVNVTPLLRELILHAVRSSPLDLRRPEHERLVGVVVDLLRPLPQAPLQLPMPLDPHAAAAVARAVADDPGGAETVATLARSAVPAGTLERIFVAETGLGVGRWRQRLRLLRALELLAAGEPVTTVAGAVGYRTPSAVSRRCPESSSAHRPAGISDDRPHGRRTRRLGTLIAAERHPRRHHAGGAGSGVRRHRGIGLDGQHRRRARSGGIDDRLRTGSGRGARQQAERDLAALNGAQLRLDAGTYATCGRCGGPIPYERLLAVPTTSRCVACAAIDPT